MEKTGKQVVFPPIVAERVRRIEGGFSFIPHRFLMDGFFASLLPKELLLYFLLLVAGDRNGVSFYGLDAILGLLGFDIEQYMEARRGLMEKDLIAFDGRRYQVLSLPRPIVQVEKNTRRPHFCEPRPCRSIDYRRMVKPVFVKNEREKRRDSAANVVHPLQFQGDDETLIAAMIMERPQAFRAFYQRHASLVYAVLLRTLGDDNELEILIQEVFTKAFQSIRALKDPTQVKSWLASIAVHTARDTIKQRRRARLRFVLFEPSALPEPCEPSPSTLGDMGEREAVSAVYRLLDTLGVDARIAFTLRYINEMELTEVAAACAVSVATIKRRLAKAKRQFCALAKADPALREWALEGMGHFEDDSSKEWGAL